MCYRSALKYGDFGDFNDSNLRYLIPTFKYSVRKNAASMCLACVGTFLGSPENSGFGIERGQKIWTHFRSRGFDMLSLSSFLGRFFLMLVFEK